MGYHRAGFDQIVGVDINPQPRYPFEFVKEDAIGYLIRHGHEFDAIHASPPCQGYSIMHNLPWLKHREYPLLILPIYELLEELGEPYVIENVMGARHGAKGLTKRGLEAHGLQAGWLCGGMFGLPFYRHRLFATNWFWMQPGHPKHLARHAGKGGKSWESFKTLRKGDADLMSGHGAFIYGDSEDSRGVASWPGRRGEQAGLAVRQYTRKTGPNAGKVETVTKTGTTEPGYGLTPWQGNGAQNNGVGIGHAKGWQLAAAAMGIDWMKREELTQAIPPAYTEYIGKALLKQIAAVAVTR